MEKIKLYWNERDKNFGDILNPIIFNGLGFDFEKAEEDDKGKLLAIGSVIYVSKENDIVWGSGILDDKPFDFPLGMEFLAVRGPKTKKFIKGYKVPDVFGDPAIFMPDIYKPKIQEKHKIGYVPHYVDLNDERLRGKYIINVKNNPLKVIDDICSCEVIISSSLHGIIIAEAYGIPAVWVKMSEKIIGGNFKFNDYFLGSGRKEQKPSELNKWKFLPKPFYEKEKLLNALKNWILLN